MRPAILLAALALLVAAAPGPSSQKLWLKDEGGQVGWVNQLNCVGDAITCSRVGLVGTIAVDGGGGGGSSSPGFDGGFTLLVGQQIQFDGGYPAPDAGIYNSLSGANVSKGWARILAGTASPQIKGGANVAACTCASNTVTVNLAISMDALNYLSPSVSPEAADRACRAYPVHPSAFNVTCKDTSGSNINLCSTADWIHVGMDGYQGVVPAPAPLALWRLDDNDGGTQMDDDAGYTPLTATNGPTSQTGHISRAQEFDGANDYLKAAHAPAFLEWQAGDMTFEAWVYLGGGFPLGWPYLWIAAIHQVSGGTGNWPMVVTLKSDKKFSIAWTQRDTNLWSWEPAMTALSLTTWTHVAVTRKWNITTSKFDTHAYVNGTDIGVTDSTSGPVNIYDDLEIVLGSHTDLVQNLWTGRLDHVSFTPRAKTAAEIAADAAE